MPAKSAAADAVPVDADRLRFAVVGCGTFARAQHIPNIARSAKAALEVCCDVSPASLEACKPFNPTRTTTDWRDAVADPRVQAVLLATTESLRLPVIELAASLGKGVYVEKPLAADVAAMRAIQKVVHQSGIPFCLGHNRRAAPAFVEARRIFRGHLANPKPCPWRFDREKAGRPKLPDDAVPAISVRINDDWWSWVGAAFDKTKMPLGPMLFEMTHFVDICNWFLDAEPLDVFAMETGMLTHSVIIRYANGSLATIASSANGSFGYPKELYECMGAGGVVAVDHMVEVRTAGIEGAPPRITFPMRGDKHEQVGAEGGIGGWLAKKKAATLDAERAGNPMLQFTAEPDRGHARAIDRFVDQIQGRGPEFCGVDGAVLAGRVCFAAIRSAKEGRIVPLAEI
ncbi:MAG: Gfo/Idh/MocA family oxidoreductase [Planctomycetota bacterium]|nr:Gfo/Idh/MocA family oxidoreductase [Planctomycetota bacterium]